MIIQFGVSHNVGRPHNVGGPLIRDVLFGFLGEVLVTNLAAQYI